MSKRFPQLDLPGRWTITTWYDRRSRNYISQLKDYEGNQIGDAAIVSHKDDVEMARGYLVYRYWHDVRKKTSSNPPA